MKTKLNMKTYVYVHSKRKHFYACVWESISRYCYMYRNWILDQYYYAEHLPEHKMILYKTMHLVIDVNNWISCMNVCIFIWKVRYSQGIRIGTNYKLHLKVKETSLLFHIQLEWTYVLCNEQIKRLAYIVFNKVWLYIHMNEFRLVKIKFAYTYDNST